MQKAKDGLKPVEITLTPELIKQLDAMAKAHDMTRLDFLAALIRAHVEKLQKLAKE